jgi:hypothetical protein
VMGSCLNAIVIDVRMSLKRQDHYLKGAISGFYLQEQNRTRRQSNLLLSLVLAIQMSLIETIEHKQET